MHVDGLDRSISVVLCETDVSGTYYAAPLGRIRLYRLSKNHCCQNALEPFYVVQQTVQANLFRNNPQQHRTPWC
eukprot:2590938-Rhodomonas_salina.1